MSNLNIRGLPDRALAERKARAFADGISVNAVVRRLIEQALARRPATAGRRRHDDLDALAGRWRAGEGAAFQRATLPFRRCTTF